ncbi:hypothetical protein E2I00_020090, partial [Balaenoptera physalus]
SARSKFYIREPPHGRPDWLKVGLTLGTSVFLWMCVSIYSLKSCYSSTLERTSIGVYSVYSSSSGFTNLLSCKCERKSYM